VSKALNLRDIIQDARVTLYIEGADRHLEAIGYTEHNVRHATKVAETSEYILRGLNYPEKDVLLSAVAGYLHDIGNFLGRQNHDQMGAILSKDILDDFDVKVEDAIRIMAAIGLHESEDIEIYDPGAAALLIADKADVHRSRVRNPSMVGVDIHDRVNYAVTESKLVVNAEAKTIILSLSIDTNVSQVIEYFEIFLSRMMVCKKAALALGCEFQLYINNTRMA
jgi:hypothetical protein